MAEISAVAHFLAKLTRPECTVIAVELQPPHFRTSICTRKNHPYPLLYLSKCRTSYTPRCGKNGKKVKKGNLKDTTCDTLYISVVRLPHVADVILVNKLSEDVACHRSILSLVD